MKIILPFLLVVLFSCAKPSQEDTSSVDSTAAYQPASGLPSTIPLTPEERELAAWATFQSLHNWYVREPESMAYVEEFTTNVDTIHYTLLLHNGDSTGLHIRERDEGEIVIDTTYVNEIDSMYANGTYGAFLEGGTLTSKDKKIRIIFSAAMTWPNHKKVNMSGEPDQDPSTEAIGDFVIETGVPLSIPREKLYLRAKMADLTENDLAGLSKEELGYLRNEIYARHGHTFKTDKMTKYFRQQPWYRPAVDEAGPLLNQFEKRNVELIKRKEG